MMKREQKRLFWHGYTRAKREQRARREQLEREIARVKAERDEVRSALAEWRQRVEERRVVETVIVDFYRNALHREREGMSLH